MGGSEKGCEGRLRAIFNKIEISNPTISLMNYIDTPPILTSNNMLAIVDSGANIHLEKQATPAMPLVMMVNDMKAILPYGSTMDSTHTATFQLLGPSKESRQIHILPKM